MDAVISLIVILVSVYLLAIITEEFFIISLDEVSKRLKLPSDVAGASLMAIGSSAPELFIALIGLIIGGDHSEVGMATIVGSAIFNILVITGMSAVVAGSLIMKRGAVERDIIFYLGSIGILLFVFSDGEIILTEALIMLGAYTGYLILLWFWSRTNPEDAAEGTIGGHHTPPKDPLNPIAKFNQAVTRIFGLIARDPEKNYIWALIVSVLCIAGISYGLVESAVIIAHRLDLSPLLVSITLLAAGTSAPDLIASVDVARDGRGTMAVANAVGSNIFDVLVGLGLPWLLTIIFISSTVLVNTDGLIESIFLLSATTILLYAALNTQRELTRREGYVLLLAYGAYVIYMIITTA